MSRKTSETDIYISLDLDGHGRCDISTGLGFFDHMLNQIGRHSGFDLTIKTKGDLYVDEHHTVEDTALALGEALRKALGDKRGIERYGFVLPMDDCNCTVALDFGGRPWLVWNADFKRERIGDVPTYMSTPTAPTSTTRLKAYSKRWQEHCALPRDAMSSATTCRRQKARSDNRFPRRAPRE